MNMEKIFWIISLFVSIVILILGQSTTTAWQIDWDNPFCKYPCGKEIEGELNGSLEDGKPKCEKPNELLLDPNNCERYFQCDHGRASGMQCPSTLTFDDEKKACVPSHMNSRSECESEENNSNQQSTQSSLQKFCEARVETGDVKVGSPRLYPSLDHPCRQYYICVVGGHSQLGSCPPEQSFDASKKKCETTINVLECVKIDT